MLTLGLWRWSILVQLQLTTLFLLFSSLLTENALADPSISVNPTQGPVGTQVMVSGSGWPPGDLINFCWNFNCESTDTSVKSDGNGTFTRTITVPQNAPIGHTYIDAGDQAAFITAQAPFEVTGSQSQPSPGWYRNNGPATIYEDSSGTKIVWENSYIYQHPGPDNLYWYAQVKYLNEGSQTVSLSCVGLADPSHYKEHIRGTEGIPPDGDGYVAADETLCSRNPNFTASLKPGEVFYEWAIFHNVPPGGEVTLEVDPFPFSPSWVDPWHSSFSAPPPAECPPELVTLGTCVVSWALPFQSGTSVSIGPLGLHDHNFKSMADDRTGTVFTFNKNLDPDSLDIVLEPETTGTSSIPTTSLANGTVLAVWSACQLVLIDHENGWWAIYLHMANIQVTSGSTVTTGSIIGYPTTNIPTLEACGSVESSAEHVHIAFLNGSGTTGTYVPMLGRSFCGYPIVEQKNDPTDIILQGLTTTKDQVFRVPQCP
jgi:hypothetical protein